MKTLTCQAILASPSVVAVLVCVFATGVATAQTELRWQFKQGDNLHYTIDEKMRTKMKARDKGAFVMSQQLVLDTTWSVERVDKTGTAALSVSIDRIRFQADGNADNMDVKVKYDSADETKPRDQPAKGVAQMFRAMIGRPITLDMTALGEISNVKLNEKTTAALQTDIGRELSGFFGDTFAADGIKRRLSEAMVVLPKGALAKGDSWKQRASAENAKPGAASVRTYTYKGALAKADQRFEVIDVKAELIPGQKIKEKIKKQHGEGVIYFDNRAGYLTRSQVNFKMSLDVEFLLQSEHEWTMRVERKTR